MLRPSEADQTNDDLDACPTTAADDNGLVEGATQSPSSTCRAWQATAAQGDSPPSSDDEDSATLSDDKLVLNPSSLIRAARSQGIWLFKIEYNASLLNPAFFGQLLVTNSRLSSLVEVAEFSEDHCCVRWRPEWVPSFEPQLPDNYSAFARRIDAVTSGEDEVRWHSHDSAYTANGLDERHHMCLDGCWRCTDSIIVPSEGEVSFLSFSRKQHLQLMR